MDKEKRSESFKNRIKSEGKITKEMVEKEIETISDDVSFFLEGLYDIDLSDIDTSDLSQENFERLTFYSDETIFSPEQEKNFRPGELIEKGKSLEGIKSFQKKGINGDEKKGINGDGTSIVIIDSCFNSNIGEFKEEEKDTTSRIIEHIVFELDNKGDISHKEYKGDVDDDHGRTTACLAAGNTCGVAPKTKMYLFGNGEGTIEKKGEKLEAMLEYIKENGIVPDIIALPDISQKSERSEEILKELEEKGCILLDSDRFWKDFSLGKVKENGEVVKNDYMEAMLNMEYNENSKIGKRIAKVKENMTNTILFPADGRTSVHKDGYKYIGSFRGASFAIAQVAGLFLLARQINKDISYDNFIEIAKETAKTNSEGMKHLDTEAMLTKIKEIEKPVISDDSAKKFANNENTAMEKQNVQEDIGELEHNQKNDINKIPSISE